MAVVLLAASKDKNRYRIDYMSGSSAAIEIFEDMGFGILETSFDHVGEIVDQKLLKRGINIEEAAKTFLSGIEGEVKAVEYHDVEFARACPSCGSTNIRRDIKALNDNSVPIVPRYICSNCGAHLYRLSDRYLEKLVYSNSQTFSKDELDALEKNRTEFMKELKGHIIRIFASKKIMEIR